MEAARGLRRAKRRAAAGGWLQQTVVRLGGSAAVGSTTRQATAPGADLEAVKAPPDPGAAAHSYGPVLLPVGGAVPPAVP